jgi:hypothetical protein
LLGNKAKGEPALQLRVFLHFWSFPLFNALSLLRLFSVYSLCHCCYVTHRRNEAYRFVTLNGLFITFTQMKLCAAVLLQQQ